MVSCTNKNNASAEKDKQNKNLTVKIGSQIWATQNLDLSTFRNGDDIPEAKTNEEWSKAEKEKKPFDLQNYYTAWISKTCECCGNDFETKLENQKFCSMTCNSFSQRKVIRPTKEELEKLINDGVTWVKLGDMFKVSDNGVRKWAKSYNLI